MGERKVQNKYFSPDFDYKAIPKAKRSRNEQYVVRMMLPMTVQCSTCGDYVMAGKKFNSKKETVEGEDYLGIRIFRFYMKCPCCSSQFTIKTDPQNSDYSAEWGCTRNYERAPVEKEPTGDDDAHTDQADAMLALEQRTRESKREMDILDGLDEIRALNARNSRLTPD